MHARMIRKTCMSRNCCGCPGSTLHEIPKLLEIRQLVLVIRTHDAETFKPSVNQRTNSIITNYFLNDHVSTVRITGLSCTNATHTCLPRTPVSSNQACCTRHVLVLVPCFHFGSIRELAARGGLRGASWAHRCLRHRVHPAPLVE